MYAEIIPQIRTIPKLGIFDYNIPEGINLNVGDIVEVEFKKTKKIGLVYRIKKQCEYKNVKSVIRKIKDVSLHETQVDLITWMTKQYGISPALAFKTVFPEIPKKTREFVNTMLQIQSHNLKIQKTRIPEIKKAVNDLSKNVESIILHYNNVNEKNAVITGLIQQKKQVLIIVPEKKYIFELAAIFKKEKPILIYSGLSKNQEWYFLNQIKNNECKLIIGTKNAIFVPPDNLDLIIIDDEEDKSHHNFDQNPKYHVLEIAEKLNKKIVLTSQTPLISSYKKYKHIDLIQSKRIDMELVDMQGEKSGGNYSFFSNKLVRILENNLNDRKKSLLLFNRKGAANLLLCQNCQEILPYSKITNCIKCQSQALKQISFGTTKIRTELETLFPDKKIIEFTKDIHGLDKIDHVDMIIGTEYALRALDLDEIDFIGIISIDHQLVVPDIMASQRVYQLITRILNLNKPCLLQTHSPENLVIRSALRQDYQRFFNRENIIKNILKKQ